MRSLPILIAATAVVIHLFPNTAAIGAEETPQKQSTLSQMGIDFGAAELGRFAELGLSEDQKRDALKVVRGRKPKIEKLCAQMTEALKMKETELKEKKAKEIELAKILKEFKTIQSEIMGGLQAIITKEQKVKLDAIKKIEEQKKLESKAKARPTTAS